MTQDNTIVAGEVQAILFQLVKFVAGAGYFSPTIAPRAVRGTLPALIISGF